MSRTFELSEHHSTLPATLQPFPAQTSRERTAGPGFLRLRSRIQNPEFQNAEAEVEITISCSFPMPFSGVLFLFFQVKRNLFYGAEMSVQESWGNSKFMRLVFRPSATKSGWPYEVMFVSSWWHPPPTGLTSPNK